MSDPNFSNVQSRGVWIEGCSMKKEAMKDTYDNSACYEASENRNEMAENKPMDQFEGFIEETCIVLNNGFPDQQKISNSQLNLEPQPTEDLDQQKIQFSAVLGLMPRNAATSISCESLSKTELSYIGKCKAMIDMHRTFVCGCHNVSHRNLTGLLSHIRTLRIWFPQFTCYNCMIRFTNRSTYARHIERCSRESLDAITRLSNMRKRSNVKIRLYQNFMCTICKITFSFHEDFRGHINDKHSRVNFPYHCQCYGIFENIEDYEDHVYTSCLVNYQCDVCSTTTKTLDDFRRHARNIHDNSEGFNLMQEDDHSMRKELIYDKELEDQTIRTGKKVKRVSVTASSTETVAYKNTVRDLLSFKSKTKRCPICYKKYSNYRNMMRHYKVHNMRKLQEHKEVVEDSVLLTGEEKASAGTDIVAYKNTVGIINPLSSFKFKNRKCPICSKEFLNYNNMKRHHKVHLKKLKVAEAEKEERQHRLSEHHESHICGDCGKSFQFQTELEQHRSIHLNLKVYRDSETQSYKSVSISPEYDDKLQLEYEVCGIEQEIVNLNLTHGSSSNASAESTSPDEKMRKCQIQKNKFAIYSDLSNHKKTLLLGRKTLLPKSFSMKDCNNLCKTRAVNHKHNLMQEKTNTSMTEIVKKNKSSAGKHHICKWCFKVFFFKNNLTNHMKCHGLFNSPTPKDVIQTPNSTRRQQAFNTTEEGDVHKEVLHNSNDRLTPTKETNAAVEFIFTCDICVATFTSKIALEKHKEEHIKIDKPSSQAHLICNYCKISFDSIGSLTKHICVVDDDSDKPNFEIMKPEAKHFSCSICARNFQTHSALSSHLGWHKRMRENKVFAELSHSTQIEQTSIDQPKFRCVTCFEELPNDIALQVHIFEKHRINDDIMLISNCNACGIDFSIQDENCTHKCMHDFIQPEHGQVVPSMERDKVVAQPKPNIFESPKSTKKYPCKYCSARFSKFHTLGEHIQRYHMKVVQQKFKCIQCDSLFNKHTSLTIHLKVHEKQRAVTSSASQLMLSCSVCNMRFDLPGNLLAHVMSDHPF